MLILIIKYISKHFDIVEKIEYGGNILHMLLDGIIANYDEEKEYDVAILKLLSYIDSILISEKVMPSDLAVVVARKKEEFRRSLRKKIPRIL